MLFRSAHRYKEAYDQLPQNLILGSETASTVSSRGVYKFPVEDKKSATYDDHQCSSYDVEACSWSNIPDEDFALADDNHWTIGQFVWTGFDYLGEPSPYDTNAWPNHSSMFGNSFKSDIQPVLSLGGYGVHIPFEVMWKHEVTETFAHERLKQVKRLDDLLSLLG